MAQMDQSALTHPVSPVIAAALLRAPRCRPGGGGGEKREKATNNFITEGRRVGARRRNRNALRHGRRSAAYRENRKALREQRKALHRMLARARAHGRLMRETTRTLNAQLDQSSLQSRHGRVQPGHPARSRLRAQEMLFGAPMRAGWVGGSGPPMTSLRMTKNDQGASLPLRHDAARRSADAGRRLLGRGQAPDRTGARYARRRLHRGRLAWREPDGHRVFRSEERRVGKEWRSRCT